MAQAKNRSIILSGPNHNVVLANKFTQDVFMAGTILKGHHIGVRSNQALIAGKGCT